MKIELPQHYFSRVVRAIVEFDLITANDKILIGLSGGKDSLFLTYAMAVVRKYSPRPFELAAFTLDAKFSNDMDTARLANFCSQLNIPYYTEQADIAGIIAQNNGKDPCYTCAFFRRGAINGVAVKLGFNKIAYAHHHDDAVETFLMGILYSGQLKTFLPKTYLDRSGLTVIRPLIYFREREIKSAAKYHGQTPLVNPCPYNGHTTRQTIKELIDSFEKQDRAIYTHLAAAMRQSNSMELWPAELSRDQLQKRFKDYWKVEDAKN